MSDQDNNLFNIKIFSWLDFFVFIIMSVLCILIGIYFGSLKKAHSELNYLMGGRNMRVLPTAISLVATFVSGVTLLGVPTEIYLYGIQYLYIIGSIILTGIVISVFFLPVFHNLKITTTYEYLERRFDRRLRIFGSVIFTLKNISYLPIVIYVPALALNQVSDISVHVITPIVCIICVFYTSLGGLKAVVWTDVVQTISMLGALILIAVKGSSDIGGTEKVMRSAWNSKRIEAPILSLDPTIRHTLWTQLIGGLLYWTQSTVISQNMMQRYFSLPTLTAGRQALWLFCIGVLLFEVLCSYIGLLIYATYEHCDPLTIKLVKARDQLLPLFVMDTIGEIPGLTGVFMAGVFSAALSSLSTCFNSMSAVVLEDFVKPYVNKPLSKNAVKWIMILTVVGMGVLCVLLVYIVEHMGTVLQLTTSLQSIPNGTLFGIFAIGVFMPWINGNSALTGGIISVIVMAWITLKTQWAIASSSFSYEIKELSADQCSHEFDSQIEMSMANKTQQDGVENIETGFGLHRVSYMWYTCLGSLLTILIAVISTYFFGANDPSSIDSSLLTPCIRSRFRTDKEYKPVSGIDNVLRRSGLKLSEEAML